MMYLTKLSATFSILNYSDRHRMFIPLLQTTTPILVLSPIKVGHIWLIIQFEDWHLIIRKERMFRTVYSTFNIHIITPADNNISSTIAHSSSIPLSKIYPLLVGFFLPWQDVKKGGWMVLVYIDVHKFIINLNWQPMSNKVRAQTSYIGYLSRIQFMLQHTQFYMLNLMFKLHHKHHWRLTTWKIQPHPCPKKKRNKKNEPKRSNIAKLKSNYIDWFPFSDYSSHIWGNMITLEALI